MTGWPPPRLQHTIVCGVRAGERAPAVAAVAGMLARRLGRSLELLHVSEPGAPPDVGLIRTVQGSLEGLLDPADVIVRLESGDPEERLAAAGDDADLLVVGTAEGAIRRALGQDVTSAVVREPAVPVIVVPSGEGAGERSGRGVVCGVRDRRDLACARAAAKLAGGLGEPLVLVHVQQPPISTAIAIEAAPPPVPQEQRGRVDALLEECAATVAEQLPEPPLTLTEPGQPGPELARVAHDRKARFLAVGSSERGPLTAALTGAASRHLIHHSQVPVMICPRGDRGLIGARRATRDTGRPGDAEPGRAPAPGRRPRLG